MFCSKCGKQNKDGYLFCIFCGSKLEKPLICSKCGANNRLDYRFCNTCGNRLVDDVEQKQNSTENKVTTVVQKQISAANNTDTTVPQLSLFVPSISAGDPRPPYTVYQSFYDGKTWATITDRSLIANKMEYPYGILSNIDLMNTPAHLLNGVAGAFANGQYLCIGFQSDTALRFMKALEYANWQIDKAHGKTKSYLFVFQDNLNTKIEVYSDYIIYYSITKGVVAALTNNLSMEGMKERIVEFANLNVGINTKARFARFIIDNVPIDIKIDKNDLDRAVNVVNYINEMKSTPRSDEISIASFKACWQTVVGEERTFPIEDKVLFIPKEMDLFNSYMLKFRAFASELTDAMIAEFNRKVNDLMTFVEYFPGIYEKYLNAVIEKAIDILVADGIWSVTKESLRARYVQECEPSLIDHMATLLKNIAELVSLNQNDLSLSMAIFPMLADRIGDIKHVQLAYLYSLLDFDALYHDVFVDYTFVFFPMVSEMKEAGKEIWFPSQEDLERSRNIYQNINHPNFPKEKSLEVLLTILKTDPYQEDYYKYMIAQWGENEQTTAIKNYFGYFEFDNPRMRFSS